MNYKWLSVILGIICIALGINFYRLQNYANNLNKVNCPDLKELEELRFQKISWGERENVFLKQNAELVTLVNDLKMQLENNNRNCLELEQLVLVKVNTNHQGQ